MINVERLLGGLIQSTVSGAFRPRARRRSSGGIFGVSRGAMGMGIIGVAIAAFDHFTRSSQGPPPPVERAGAAGPPPPPPPPRSGGTGPPPPPPAARPESAANAQALHLLRAMIAAANADHVIDADERTRILEHLSSMGLSNEERELLNGEISRPQSADSIAREALSRGMEQETYLVSLLAIDLDSIAERAYLSDLSGRLRLDAGTVARCHEQAGAPIPT